MKVSFGGAKVLGIDFVCILVWREMCMKNQILSFLLFVATAATAQPIVQPLSSGDYWKAEEYNRKLREFAYNNQVVSPITTYSPGSEPFQAIRVVRENGENVVEWPATPVKGVSKYIIEYSRDKHNFEPAGEVYYGQTFDGDRYVFHHPLLDNRLMYYRVGVVNLNNNVVAYSPPALMTEAEFSTKVFPTAVKGHTFYVQIGHPYEKLQVLNSLNQSVYEEAINERTGLITVVLPTLPKGMYFVRLISDKQRQFVQKIMVD